MGCREHAQARARPWRAALRRRDHPRRVPAIRREGRRPGAAIPEGPRRRAQRWRTRSRSCGGSRNATRSITGWTSATPQSWPPPRCPTGTSPTAGSRTRQSILWTRPPAGSAWRSIPSPSPWIGIERRLIQLKIEREALRQGERRRLARASRQTRVGHRRERSGSSPTSKRSGRPRRRRCRGYTARQGGAGARSDGARDGPARR